MKAWFFGLQPRERMIVAIGAAAAIAIVLWGLVIQPMRGEVGRLRSSVETKQRLLVNIARVEGEMPATVTGNRQGVGETLVVIVDNTARSHGLDLPRTRANGPSGVDVSFQNARFDSLVAWLIVLHDSYGVDVDTASFSSAREPGLVNGQISLRRL